MDSLLSKIDKLLIGDESGATTTDNVTTNTAKEEECPEGQKW